MMKNKIHTFYQSQIGDRILVCHDYRSLFLSHVDHPDCHGHHHLDHLGHHEILRVVVDHPYHRVGHHLSSGTRDYHVLRWILKKIKYNNQ